jgi:hypothetical protein
MVITIDISLQEWKDAYISKHREMASMILMALKSLKNTIDGKMLDVFDYFRAVGHLKRLRLKIEDVYFFLFRKELNVAINMVAVHYAFFCLRVPVNPFLYPYVVCMQRWI